MFLTPVQTLIMIGAVALGTIITRFAPFVLFPVNKEQHPLILHLGKVLPPAMIGLLVVYCLRNVHLLESPHGLPQGAAILLIVILHLWRRNVLLSIGAGTAFYMLLIQIVFPA